MIDNLQYMIYNAYDKYYINPNHENKEELAQTIIKLGIPCQIDITPKFIYTDDNATLVSNGSTYNCGTRYKFGPHPMFWIQTIERELRGSGTMVAIGCPSQFSNTITQHKYKPVDNHPQFDVDYSCEIRTPRKTMNILHGIFCEYGQLNLVAHPHVWLYIFSNDEYRGLLSESKIIKSIINTDSDMFFRTDGMPFKFNNQMINWKTGVNFYTCDYNNIHSLPTFNNDRAINLLNQNYSNHNNDDELKLSNIIEWCQCGKQMFKSTFIPHKNNQIMLNGEPYRPLILINELQCNYSNLQFHQTENSIDVYYSTRSNMSQHDREVIKHYFRQFKLRFYRNSLFYIGRKVPAFWRGENLCIIENKMNQV